MTGRSRMKGVSEQCINLLSGLYLLTGRQPERETPDMGEQKIFREINGFN